LPVERAVSAPVVSVELVELPGVVVLATDEESARELSGRLVGNASSSEAVVLPGLVGLGVVPVVLLDAIPELLAIEPVVPRLELSGGVRESSVVDVDADELVGLVDDVLATSGDDGVDEGVLLLAIPLSLNVPVPAVLPDGDCDDDALEAATPALVEDSPVGKSERINEDVMLPFWPAGISSLAKGTRNLPLSPAKSASASTRAIAVPFWKSMTTCSISPTS